MGKRLVSIAAAFSLILVPPLHKLSGEAMTGGEDALLAQNGPAVPKIKHRVPVTGYSSTPEETDETPFITASGSRVRPGTAAANFLPFGTKIKIPAVFGDRIFTIEDRMHEKNGDKVDIWFPSKEEALEFGVRRAVVEVL